MENMGVLEKLISRNNISMEIRKVESNPVLMGAQGTEDMDHFQCSLSRPGKRMDVYMSVEGSEENLTLEDVFFVLAMDASSCELLEGFEEYQRDWPLLFGGSDGNMKELDDFWREYEGRCRQAEELRRFLGNSDYQELMGFFHMENAVNMFLSPDELGPLVKHPGRP